MRKRFPCFINTLVTVKCFARRGRKIYLAFPFRYGRPFRGLFSAGAGATITSSYALHWMWRGDRVKSSGFPFIATSAAAFRGIMRIALGADHAGFELKEKIKQYLTQQGVSVADQGTDSPEAVDYPDYARKVAEEVVAGRAELGIGVCGTGIGMCIAANKVPGIRAASVTSEFQAEMSRAHNDANFLCLGGRVLKEEEAIQIVAKWLHTDFAGGRHQRRVEKIMAIEQKAQRASL